MKAMKTMKAMKAMRVKGYASTRLTRASHLVRKDPEEITSDFVARDEPLEMEQKNQLASSLPLSRRSGFSTSCSDSLRQTCLPLTQSLQSSLSLEPLEEKCGGDGGFSATASLSKMMGLVRQQALVECRSWSIADLMGARWTELAFRWTWEIKCLLDGFPEFQKGNWADECNQMVLCKDHVLECLMGQALDMVRITSFMEKKGLIAVLQDGDSGAEDDSNLSDPQMHELLRGGMKQGGNQADEEVEGWKVVTRSKRKQSQKLKSYYSNVRCNLSAVKAAPGSMEDMSWDSHSTEEDTTSEDQSDLRGGALGSSTTGKKRQVTEAIGQMEAILAGLQTQPSESGGAAASAEVDDMIKEFKDVLDQWEAKKPTKEEIKKQIGKLLEKMKGSQGEGGSTSTSSTRPQSARQTFYAEFQKEAIRKAEEKNQKQLAKGKGKGKSKGKGKGKNSGEEDGVIPKYDLKQAFPTMSVTSWQLIQRSLEDGEEPKGMVAVCPSLDKVAELQSLAAIHELKNNIILIVKAEEKEAGEKIKGSKPVLLPYMGNLALVAAVIASLNGELPQFDGTNPIRAKDLTKVPKKENMITLRVMVVKGVLSDKDLEVMKQKPTYAMFLLGCSSKFKELKTSGWTEQAEAFVGYLEVEKVKNKIFWLLVDMVGSSLQIYARTSLNGQMFPGDFL